MDGARREALRLLAACAGSLAMDRAMSQPSPLITRPVPATGEPLPVIGLGTWQVFDAGSDSAAKAIPETPRPRPRNAATSHPEKASPPR